MRHSTCSGVKISPNGENLATTVDRGDQDVFKVVRTKDRSVVKISQLPDPKSAGSFYWTSPDRLLFKSRFPWLRTETTICFPLASMIKLPVYLAAGARDARAVPEQTEAMNKALINAGNPPEGMIIQSGEMHGFHKEENNLKLYTEMLKFFDRHIGSSRPMAAAPMP